MTMNILILTDSRGFGLEKEILKDLRIRYPDILHQINLTVIPMGGAKAENILIKIDKLYPTTEKFDVIYAFVGVNNLTVKTGKRRVEPVFDDISERVEMLTDSLSNSR